MGVQVAVSTELWVPVCLSELNCGYQCACQNWTVGTSVPIRTGVGTSVTVKTELWGTSVPVRTELWVPV